MSAVVEVSGAADSTKVRPVTADLISRAEMAKQLNVCPHTLRGWERSGRGPPALRIGKRVYYRAQTVRSYTEVSVSGTGVHIIARASVPENRKVNGIEIYDRRRFFTMTGWHLEGTPLTIEDAQAPVMKLWEEVTAHRGDSSGNAIDQDAIDSRRQPRRSALGQN